MKYNPQKHHRKSIRLKGYDYSQAGLYFVTICTQNRACLFGHISNGKMKLNDAGEMDEHWYYELENKFNDIKCHEMVVMPNHIHFIVETVGADLRVCPNEPITPITPVTPFQTGQTGQTGETGETGEHAGSPLPTIVQWFKTMTTNEYIRGVKNFNWKRFDGKLWQRNYWEHIVRNENEYQRISQYIINNPQKWVNDKFNNGDGHILMEKQSPYKDEPWMI